MVRSLADRTFQLRPAVKQGEQKWLYVEKGGHWMFSFTKAEPSNGSVLPTEGHILSKKAASRLGPLQVG